MPVAAQYSRSISTPDLALTALAVQCSERAINRALDDLLDRLRETPMEDRPPIREAVMTLHALRELRRLS